MISADPPRGPWHTPAPGTPTVPLSVLLADPGLGLKRIAGPDEDRFVEQVGTTELADPTPYLIGGELLLTAGSLLPRTSEGIDDYVRRVVEAGTVALGFGIVPVYEEVPPDLIAACDRHDLPLLLVPKDVPFVAVARATHSAMAEARTHDLRLVSEAQSALASAAARPDALAAVLHQLSVHLGVWAVLLDGNGAELLAAGTRPAVQVTRQLCELAARTAARQPSAPHDRTPAPGSRPPTAAAQHHAGIHLTVHTVPGGDTTGPLALGLVAASRPTPVHRSVTGTAIVLLSLLTNPRHALGGDTRTAGAVVRLLLGGAPAEIAPMLLPADAPDDAAWTVVHGRPARSARGPGAQPGGDPVHLAALGTALGTPYLDLAGPVLRALIPWSARAQPTESADAARLGWHLGFSAPVGTADLPVADTQAERALRRAVASGLPTVHHRTVEQSVHSIVAPREAKALARARFAPLDRAPAPGPAVLMETLRTWLSQYGSWDRTAAALGLHRNTVRQRISRVSELLDVDLQDPEVRMELWFALHWLPGERSSLDHGQG
ncbi:PucR family transcriptional regulator [Streptomyces sp. NPDC005970]|uniref:PucR family transcriptional regulator n=1 Tax=Streptomyces sp. NPDC005970 TaxID=3156723 RepID=UPI0033EC50A0